MLFSTMDSLLKQQPHVPGPVLFPIAVIHVRDQRLSEIRLKVARQALRETTRSFILALIYASVRRCHVFYDL